MQIVEIKALNASVASIRRDLMKSEEQLEDAKRLQKFLDELVPEEWREGQVKERDDKHAMQMAIWQAEIDNARDALQVYSTPLILQRQARSMNQEPPSTKPGLQVWHVIKVWNARMTMDIQDPEKPVMTLQNWE